MSKIYNEVVIDMNPESPTFEETLYEDSFEYSGDMMLMDKNKKGDQVFVKRPEGFYVAWQYDGGGTWNRVYGHHDTVPASHGGPIFHGGESEFNEYKAKQTAELETGKEWGAADIESTDFIDDAGNPLDLGTVTQNLKNKFPDKNIDDIRKLVEDLAPKFQKVDPQEKAQLAKEKEFAQRGIEAEKGRAEDVYGLGVSAVGRERKAAELGLGAGMGQLQQQAGKMGAQMRGAYGGMGGGMRGAIGGQATMARGVEQTYGKYGLQMGTAADKMTQLGQEKGYAQDAYGLAMDKAAFAEETGLYGLDKEAKTGYEQQIAGFIEQGEFKEGGRVPEKGETFLSFLTQLPDAGGS